MKKDKQVKGLRWFIANYFSSPDVAVLGGAFMRMLPG